jgi:hypothetical protein
VLSSHELVEAVTDPAYTVAEAWSDDSSPLCGEIGDICFPQLGMAAGYHVQLEWSNALSACVDHNPAIVSHDFALALDMSSVQASVGGSATLHVSASVAAGSQPTTISLTVTGPSGVTGQLSPTMLASNASATLTLAVEASVASGSYPFAVVGKDADGDWHTVTGMLTVGGAGGQLPGGTTGTGTTGMGNQAGPGASQLTPSSRGCSLPLDAEERTRELGLLALVGVWLLVTRSFTRSPRGGGTR